MSQHYVGKWVVTCKDDGKVVIANEYVSNVYDALSLSLTLGSFIVGTRIDAYDDTIVTAYEQMHIRSVVADVYFTN